MPVYTGVIAAMEGWRQMDMKMGEDGNLYIAINRNVSGYNGYVSVYRSTDAGRHWIGCQSAANVGAYFNHISMVVEKRHNTNNDSIRILVYFTSSTSPTMENATLALVSFRRMEADGMPFLWELPLQEISFSTLLSAAMNVLFNQYFYTLRVQEVTNSSGSCSLTPLAGLLIWGESHTSATFDAGNSDFYPTRLLAGKLILVQIQFMLQ